MEERSAKRSRVNTTEPFVEFSKGTMPWVQVEVWTAVNMSKWY